MERLTIRNSDGSVSQPTNMKWAEALEKLTADEDAEEQGRLVILPPKLYEAVDVPVAYGVVEWDVTGVRYYDGEITAYTVRNSCSISIINGYEIGKTVFLSREEAEAALKGDT